MGVGSYKGAKGGAGANPSRGHPPTGMFGQLMGREDLAAHSQFKKKSSKKKGKGPGKKSSRKGTKKPGF
jgi:hypothetical protein